MKDDEISIQTFSDNDPAFIPENAADTAMLLLKDENPELYDKVMEIKERLIEQLPSIDKILEQPMNIEDQTKLYELCEVFFRAEPLTLEWIELKNHIQTLYQNSLSKYEQWNKMEQTDKDTLQTELEKLRSYKNTELSLEYKIALLSLPLEYKSKIYQRFKVWENMNSSTDEYSKLSEWLNTIVQVPFQRYKKINREGVLERLKEQLDLHFYGLESVKEQIMIYVNNRLNGISDGNVCLALKGPPGVGKTHIALTLAKILDYPFQQLSGSNLNTLDNICGHSYTYIGSKPGDIVNSMTRLGYNNGILFIDEFDKIPLDNSLNTILQILDPVQNNSFKDRYIGDIPVDLSHLWFILSMNELPENKALTDRMFVIEIPEYKFQDKMEIIKKYTLPKIMKELKLDIEISDEVIETLIRRNDGTGGVRSVIYALKDILYKLKFIVQHPNIQTSFSKQKLVEPFTLTNNIANKLMTEETPQRYQAMYM